MKYIITVAQRFYGEIEVEANDREEAKAKALDEANLDKIKWFDTKQYQVAEVEQIGGNLNAHLPTNQRNLS